MLVSGIIKAALAWQLLLAGWYNNDKILAGQQRVALARHAVATGRQHSQKDRKHWQYSTKQNRFLHGISCVPLSSSPVADKTVHLEENDYYLLGNRSFSLSDLQTLVQKALFIIETNMSVKYF